VHPDQPQTAILFYDGYCGLCRLAVQFVLNHDRSGTAFRFAPLQGTTFQALVPADSRAAIPDSLAVLSRDGSLMVRSDACIHVLRRLGGAWRTAGALAAIVPRPLRDALYDRVAGMRYRIFGRRDNVCPAVAPDLRQRFDP
jgi:predicted DCC family thiol-disulfide oxidoreductase YuxK